LIQPRLTISTWTLNHGSSHGYMGRNSVYSCGDVMPVILSSRRRRLDAAESWGSRSSIKIACSLIRREECTARQAYFALHEK
jgi:hypothetical protein